jgi:uncharacterized membrane protein (DUF373 family)
MVDRLPRNWGDMRRDWGILSVYERFEAAVAFLLRFVVGLVIVVALYRLLASVVVTLIFRSLNPLDHAVFQQVFGEILTLLIALEFNHTLHYDIDPARGIIHTRIVLLIAILALARKLIILDLAAVSATMVAALAALTVALGAAYWLVRERELGSQVRARHDAERRQRASAGPAE